MFCVILSFFSCASKSEKNGSVVTYTFNKDNAIEFVDSILSASNEIVLDTTIITPITSNTNFLFDDDRIFCYMLSYVYEFDKDGRFICKIGQVGHGKGEYVQLHDVTLDKHNKIVEVLDAQNIFRYDYDGNFISKEQVDLPFSSFIYNDGYYWFASGNNSLCGDYELYKYDKSFKQLDGVCEHKIGICIDEDNFGKGTILTYRNTFSHDVYQIIDNDAILTYTFKFPGLEIPKSLYNANVMTAMQEIESNNFAVIRRFIENERYIFMLIQEYKSENNGLSLYYWIIDKENNDERIVEFNNLKLDEFKTEIYYLNPQVLDKDNMLYFVGCKDGADIIGIHSVNLSLLFDRINNKKNKN